MARPAKLHLSVEALYAYLLFYIGGGVDEKTEVLEASLASQSKMAGFQHPMKGIIPCSLNAQKSVADQILDGGFAKLNELRVRAIDIFHARMAPPSSTKAGLRQTIADLKSEVHLIRQENIRLTIATNELIALIYRAVRPEDMQRKIFERDVGEILLRFRL